LDDGRVALELGVNGAVEGKAYFVGTPKLDTTTRMLTVPDLDFDVATANALVASLAWVKKGDLLTELRARAQVPLDPLLEETRARVEHALNRDLTDGVTLSGRVETGRLIDVAAEPQWMVVRAEAIGSIGLSVDKAIPIRGRRTTPSAAPAATAGPASSAASSPARTP
jgi:prophage tail gpP-like protein